ncbi:MAG: hypothetical protein JSW49_08420 [candidate division WOR-3 bacterium]|nr:MAG: hypothetical protein JSW49_08420 [candidate division WOR-3 bacterium]
MLLYILIGLSIGIEGGYVFPAVGFESISSGAGFAVFADRNAGIVDVSLSLQTAFNTGDNPGYSMTTMGFRFGLYKENWSISPVLAFGGDYLSRSLNGTSESGFAAAYTIGAQINIRHERLHIYPKFYYEGLTDLKVHAGFIGIKLGVGYEI